MMFIREAGKKWHAARDNGWQARCGTSFDPAQFSKDVERSENPPPTDPRCDRRGCRERLARLKREVKELVNA